MEEIWKDIEGFEGLYQVSNLGRVRSLDRIVADSRTGYRTLNGRILSLMNSQRGYQRIKLCKNGKVIIFSVHRLVAQVFIPNPDNKPEVDHIDTNPSNNRVDNLRWATNLENNRNSLTCKKRSDALKKENAPWFGKTGKANPNSKAIYQISNGNIIKKWIGMKEAARNTGLEQSCITFCCQGKQKTSGGYRWIYAEDLDNFLIEKMKRRRTAI